MNELDEQLASFDLFMQAAKHARSESNEEDRHAQTMAILARAFIMATPDLSPEGRARVFLMENEIS